MLRPAVRKSVGPAPNHDGMHSDSLPDGWHLEHGPTVTGADGETWFSRRTITLRPGLSRARHRCVLAHEVVHAERGPFPRWLTAREEATVRAEAARRLVALDGLADALSWSLWPDEVAEELGVDRSTLLARLRTLQAVELAHLQACTEHHREDS